MFIGYQKNRACFMSETLEELNNKSCVKFDRIERVEFAEMFDGVIYTSEADLKRAKCDAVRAVRNEYLEQTDKYMIADYSITEEERQSYKKYRQYLRDYSELEGWWLNNPMTADEWKRTYEPADEVIIPEPDGTATNEAENVVEVIAPADDEIDD